MKFTPASSTIQAHNKHPLTRGFFINTYSGETFLPPPNGSLSRDTKYEYSMEKVISLIDKFCAFPSIEKLVLFKLVLFNYFTGNDDMHLKNFSLITEEDKVKLSPGYDLLITTIEYRKPDNEIALPLRGKKKLLTRNMLINYYGIGKCELTTKSVGKVLETISSALPKWRDLISISFLSKTMKDQYFTLLDLRANNLKIQ